jgi:hypothetical protein
MSDDRDLQERFDRLKQVDERDRPSFDATRRAAAMRRPSASARPLLWATGCAAAAGVVFLATTQMRTSSPALPVQAPVASMDATPLDFLLRSPGSSKPIDSLPMPHGLGKALFE